METVLRGIAIYFVLLIVLRLSGRRSLAQATPFDFVLLLIIAETTQQALLGDDFSMINAILLIITLFTTDVALSYVKQWSPRAALLMDGAPTVLISRGQPDAEALRRARVSVEDVLEAARQKHGLQRLEEIEFAILEPSGSLSIVPKSGG
ncbi:uncharacterized membrane protein YcaP (DUF421 family) [Chelatococcus caeni]|uniref:Uncharacterized membrane protein YcaP (DUF421 family) n=1 Tax=Chelatococcus caeni TaxID=1348468 RepID=A0A840BYX8_9HYPH|nr:DUF421 domain-containing protein [Chelatococcus caeni]MBB4016489.1 uncharacterized membrane protein YcaP (DUF421 family) [Chelatococcus caeni]